LTIRKEDEGVGKKPEETKRIRRLVEILNLLSAQPRRWTQARLAESFGVTERQIRRDMVVMRQGLHYQIERRNGGLIICGTPVLPPLHLSLPEAIALALAAGLARDSDDIDPATLGSALARLEALAPPETLTLLRRDLVRPIHRRASPASSTRIVTLGLLQQALAERRQVRLVYETASRAYERSERVVEPYHIARHYGRFSLLTAYDHLRGKVIQFKVSRIRETELLTTTYRIPDDFDIDDYRSATFGLMRGEPADRVDIELLFSPQAARWFEEEDWDVPLQLDPQPDGNVLARMHTGITPELLRWLSWYGPDCRVLAPESLRDQVCAAAQKTVKMYRVAPKTSKETHLGQERSRCQLAQGYCHVSGETRYDGDE